MEGANVIAFERFKYETAEDVEKWNKWVPASTALMEMSSDALLGMERSFHLEEKFTYVSLNFYKDMENYFSFLRSPERNAMEKDFKITWGGKVERTWRALYFVVRRLNLFQRNPIDKGEIVDKATYLKQFKEDEAPVLVLKGLSLSTLDWEKYNAWMNEWGYDIFLPMLLKAPGIIEYCRCWLSNVRRESLGPPNPSHNINPEFPQDLSIIYFENIKAYQNFLISKELAVYEKTLVTAFPNELNYRWDVAFRLARRFTK